MLIETVIIAKYNGKKKWSQRGIRKSYNELLNREAKCSEVYRE